MRNGDKFNAAGFPAPHYTSNGAVIGSEEHLVTQWGTLKLQEEGGEGGEVTCRTASAGVADIRVGGADGVGKTELFAPYHCESTVCPNTTVVAGEGLTWPSELQKEGFTVRVKSTGVKVKVDCLKEGKSVAKFPRTFAGTIQPINKNGTSALHPAFLEFGAGSGALEQEGEPAVKGTIEGESKVLGYEEQELINVTN